MLTVRVTKLVRILPWLPVATLENIEPDFFLYLKIKLLNSIISLPTKWGFVLPHVGATCILTNLCSNLNNATNILRIHETK